MPPGRSLVLAALAAFGLLALGSLASPRTASGHTYTYTVETRGDVRGDRRTFARIARSTLRDSRGWSLDGNIAFRQVRSGGDFRLILAAARSVARAHPVCSARWSCRVGNQVLINDVRWLRTTASWTLSRRAYRSYVINHEVGHWLGLRRRSCPGAGRRAPVMMQQSISLDGCRANVWPLPGERRRVAEIRGVRGFLRGPTSFPEWPGRYLFLKRPFMTGPDVRRYQQRMRERGWQNTRDQRLRVDGIFGPQTARVTRLFQREKGLTVDGIVGPITWRAAWTEPIT